MNSDGSEAMEEALKGPYGHICGKNPAVRVEECGETGCGCPARRAHQMSAEIAVRAKVAESKDDLFGPPL